MKIKQHCCYKAIFKPIRTDDLKPGMVERIGQEVEVYAGWLIENNESYAGYWAMQLPIGWPAAWVPSCDLELI